MAGRATRCVGLSVGAGLPVDAGQVLLSHVVVAHRAVDGVHLIRVRDFSGLDVAIRALHEPVDALCEGFTAW